MKRLNTDVPQEKMYADLLKHDIAVYAAHTNMDIIEDGLNDWFCELLGVKVENYLVKTHERHYKKLAVYIPVEQAEELRKALAQAGAGQQGNYDSTSFTTIGQGRFRPNDSAHPAIGEAGQLEKVQEAKVEVIFPEHLEQKILRAMYAVHPYEEVAYDLFKIDEPTKTWGLGRIGELSEEMPLDTFVAKVKEAFQLDGLRVVRPTEKEVMVKRVAICGGSGEKFYPHALFILLAIFITIQHRTCRAQVLQPLIRDIISNHCAKRSLSKNLNLGKKKRIGLLTSLFLKQIPTHFNLTKRREFYVRKSFTSFFTLC